MPPRSPSRSRSTAAMPAISTPGGRDPRLSPRRGAAPAARPRLRRDRQPFGRSAGEARRRAAGDLGQAARIAGVTPARSLRCCAMSAARAAHERASAAPPTRKPSQARGRAAPAADGRPGAFRELLGAWNRRINLVGAAPWAMSGAATPSTAPSCSSCAPDALRWVDLGRVPACPGWCWRSCDGRPADGPSGREHDQGGLPARGDRGRPARARSTTRAPRTCRSPPTSSRRAPGAPAQTADMVGLPQAAARVGLFLKGQVSRRSLPRRANWRFEAATRCRARSHTRGQIVRVGRRPNHVRPRRCA